jgi:diaminopimelate decarboxylase
LRQPSIGLTVNRIHTHIGSGSDPGGLEARRQPEPCAWSRPLKPSPASTWAAATRSPASTGRRKATDLQAIAEPVVRLLLEAFAARTGRRIHIEIEPGTLLVANAGAVLARVQDVVDTGPEGYRFYKLDCGMTEILRPSLVWLPAPDRHPSENTRPGIQLDARSSSSVTVVNPGTS